MPARTDNRDALDAEVARREDLPRVLVELVHGINVHALNMDRRRETESASQ
jgi:hypothetical protein